MSMDVLSLTIGEEVETDTGRMCTVSLEMDDCVRLLGNVYSEDGVDWHCDGALLRSLKDDQHDLRATVRMLEQGVKLMSEYRL